MTFFFLYIFCPDRKAGTPRPLWNAAAQILMVFGFVILALALPGSLYIGSILVGICYGIRIAISVPTASELFGLKYYGLIYNILILNLPLGSFLFSGLLAGILYDMEAIPTAGGGNTCVGAHCYRTTFVVMAVACIIGFGLDILLSIRTKSVYTKIYASKKSKKSSAPSNGRRQMLNWRQASNWLKIGRTRIKGLMSFMLCDILHSA